MPQLNMNVIARTDPHAAHQDVFDAHPDWIAVDASGAKRRHPVMPELWVTCALGPYNFEFMTEVTKEIVSLYKVDGVFSNRWAGSGMCYCEHCQAISKRRRGWSCRARSIRRIPRGALTWDGGSSDCSNSGGCGTARFGRSIRARAISRTPAAGASSDLDMKTIGALAPILFADRQARSGLTAPWANGKNGKEYRSTMGRKPIGGIFSVGTEEPYRWKDSVQSGPEIRLWVLDGIANDLRPWFTKFGGTLYDRRWLPVVEDLYAWHYKNERYLRNEESLARVGMVYSQQTSHFYGGEKARAKVEDHTLGYYQALIESRIPFEMVHDGLLDAAHVDSFKVLIFPNIAALSNAQCEQIRGLWQRGGSIVATHETSLYDEWGVRRAGLRARRSVRRIYGGKASTRACRTRTCACRKALRHPILAGLEDAERIINGVSRVHTKGTYPNPPLTLIPSYPDLPMEEVFPREPKTDIAEVYVREVGKGRVVYFPWDIDRTFWEVLSVDHLKLLRNAVDWAANEPRPVAVTAGNVRCNGVEAERFDDRASGEPDESDDDEGSDSRVHSDAGAAGDRAVPAGAKAQKVQLLVGRQTIHVREANETVTLTIHRSWIMRWSRFDLLRRHD